MSTHDQTKGELCEKCGWAMKFPKEPCRCELERENAALRAQDAYLVSTVDQLERENDALRKGITLAVKWAELGLVDYLPEYARKGFLNDWKKLEQLTKESEVRCE